jgi:O-antigen ligase
MTNILSVIPRYALYTLLIFTPLARASVQPWAITTIHIITLTALTAFLLEKTLSNNWQWVRTPLDVPFVCLLLLCLLSTVFSMHFRTSFWSLILLLNYLTIYYLVINTIRTRTQLRHLIYLIIGIAAFLSIFGFFKRAGINPFPWWDYTDLKSSIISSTFGNYNHLAGYMEMAIPLVLGLFFTGLTSGKRFLLICLTCLLLAALLLTLSRGGWMSAFVCFGFMTLALLTNPHFSRKKLVGALAGVCLVLSFIVLTSTPVVERVRTLERGVEVPNLAARQKVWGGMVDMIEDHPILGTGPGTFATVFTQYQPAGLTSRYVTGHNDYLHLASEVGLFLVVIVVWMIIALYRKGFQKLKHPSRLIRGTTLGAMSAIAAILVHSVVDFNLHIPSNAVLFTVLTALVVAPLPLADPQRLNRKM